MYMVPLEDIITRHGLSCVIYADDTKMYITCDSRDDYSAVAKLEACVDEICRWLRASLLALSDGKTEIIWLSSRSGRGGRRTVATDVRIGETRVSAVDSVRDLGVMLDSAGTMNAQIKTVCKAASCSLWRIGKIRKLLDQDSAEKLIHAFVMPRLDYCNSYRPLWRSVKDTSTYSERRSSAGHQGEDGTSC